MFTATSWALSSSDDEILVGGQAVMEGVMMRSPKGYSVAVRRQDGTVRVMKNAVLTMFGFVLISAPLAASALQFAGFTYSADGSAITITGYNGPFGPVTIPPTFVLSFPLLT